MRETEDKPPSSKRNSRTLRCSRVNPWNLHWSAFRNIGYPASLAIRGDIGNTSIHLYKIVDLGNGTTY